MQKQVFQNGNRHATCSSVESAASHVVVCGWVGTIGEEPLSEYLVLQRESRVPLAIPKAPIMVAVKQEATSMA